LYLRINILTAGSNARWFFIQIFNKQRRALRTHVPIRKGSSRCIRSTLLYTSNLFDINPPRVLIWLYRIYIYNEYQIYILFYYCPFDFNYGWSIVRLLLLLQLTRGRQLFILFTAYLFIYIYIFCSLLLQEIVIILRNIIYHLSCAL